MTQLVRVVGHLPNPGEARRNELASVQFKFLVGEFQCRCLQKLVSLCQNAIAHSHNYNVLKLQLYCSRQYIASKCQFYLAHVFYFFTF